MRTEKNVPWEVKWEDSMNKIKDLFNNIEVQPDLLKNQVEIKHQS